jgi:imidazoleglycerol-phosphate dehydratase
MQNADRTSDISRQTQETKIRVALNLDGTGKTGAETGVGFFDHMLDLLGRHGLFDLTVKAEGDLHVDPHHTVEDVGIVIGQCIEKAVGDKRGIHRYGWAIVPMDETLAQVALDLSGRPAFVFNVKFTGTNNHHIAEAIFKATAKALRQAVSLDPRNQDVPSTKGTLIA